ncbi:MAG: TolC family protein [Bacteroidota bacterium]
MKNILLFSLAMAPALVPLVATETLAVQIYPNQAAADTLTLEQAYEMVSDRYPLSAQAGMQREIRDLQLENADAGWLPEFRLSGLAQYQSDVTEIDIRLPAAPDGFDIPTQPKDRYQMALDLEQRLYDGGRIRARRNLAHSRTDVALHRIRVSQHELRDRVNDAWFAIHALRAQQTALEITEEELAQRFQEITSLVEHGAVPASNADIIRAEQLRITQQMRSLKAREKSAISVLSILLDTELPADIFLQMPDVPDTPGQPVGPDFRQRPEMALFEAQRSELMQQEEMATASYRPHISAFGQAAYGRPGLDMFKDRFQPWYIVGVRASWSIWNWRTADREREILQIRQRLINNQQEIFNRTMHMAVQQDLERLAELRETIRTDKEIIALHENIVSDAVSHLEHGAITATEYINELANRQRAVINRDMHRIELARTWQNYLTTRGL